MGRLFNHICQTAYTPKSGFEALPRGDWNGEQRKEKVLMNADVNGSTGRLTPEQIDQTDQTDQVVWVLRRNCSLTPSQLLAIFCSLAGLSLAFAAFWTSQGAWVVLPFAVVECLALGVAFFVYSRHACDHERVEVSAQGVSVESVQGVRHSAVKVPRDWLRVEWEDDRTSLINLRSGQHVVSLGRFVDQASRRRFVADLKRALVAVPSQSQC